MTTPNILNEPITGIRPDKYAVHVYKSVMMMLPDNKLANIRIDNEITGAILPTRFIGKNKKIGSNKPFTYSLIPLNLILLNSTKKIVIIAKVNVTE